MKESIKEMMEAQMQAQMMQMMLSSMKPESSNDKASVVDSVVKVLVTISTAGILWLLTSVSTMQTDIATLSTQQQKTMLNMKKLERFTEQPRFTHDNFQQAIAPIQQTSFRNEQELASRRPWIKSIEDEVRSLRVELESLKQAQK